MQEPELSQYLQEGQTLENLMDASLGQGAFSFQAIMQLDEDEVFPTQACSILEKHHFHHYYVPKEHGGKLQSFESLLLKLRLIARRDLTIAIGHGKTYLGSVPVWVAGTLVQKKKLAKHILAGEVVSLGLTEKNNGSDLLATVTCAQKIDAYYRLQGEKWLINNANRCELLTIFARTSEVNPLRGFSLFLFQKSKHQHHYACLPKVSTLGIRGADISGIVISDAMLDEDLRIGPEGYGLEIIQKSMQITRTLCAGLSLGAADTSLRTTLKFALHRRLYKKSIFAIPHVKQTLINAYIDLSINEILAHHAARCLHLLTDQMSYVSALIKFYVPTSVEQIIQSLAVVLGARHYLREEHDHGIFQKMMRDNELVGLFDGSTIVNLQLLSQQVLQFAHKRKAKYPYKHEELFTLGKTLPAFCETDLKLSCHGFNDILYSIDIVYEKLCQQADTACVSPQTLFAIERVQRRRERYFDALLANSIDFNQFSHQTYASLLEFCHISVAALCISSWFYNRHNKGIYQRSEYFLQAILHHLLFHQENRIDTAFCYPEIEQELLRRYEQHQLFSLFPIQLQ